MKKTKQNHAPAPTTGAAPHHPCGPSKWPALLECPCFQSRPPTEDTQRGTELHAVFEAVMKETYAGEPADAMEIHVVNAARKLQQAANTGKFHVEEMVELPPPSDSPSTKSEFYGRLDLAWRNWDTGDLHVLDLKLSENPDRDHRAQLIGYAAGMMRRMGYTPTLVYLHVLYADTGNVTQEVLTGDEAWTEYNANYRRIESIWKGQANPLSPRQCGWCDLCASFTDCPAMKAVVDKAGPRLADAAKPERWATFTSEHKAQLCALADTLQKWCVAVKENAAADAKAGELIEDAEHCIFYSVQARKGRIELPVKGTWDTVKDCLTPDAFKACLSVSTRKLKEALMATGMKSKEADALMERTGFRGPETSVFVRRGVKEVA